MSKTKITILILFIFFFGNGQNDTLSFNLDFQEIENDFPKDWLQWSVYPIKVDRDIYYSGNHSVSIEYLDDNVTFGAIAYSIPNLYEGKTITLEGYIKTENVKEGHAGLMLRIDKDQYPLSFDNMESKNLYGTKDWKKYSITLPFHNNADVIYVGGLLAGKGKAWFDNFNLTIDGVDINVITPIEKQLSKADLDTEFDEGSLFTLNDYTKNEIKNLYELGKKWGYLKYHHPKIAEGEYNWDYELFRILPIINKPNFKSLLNQWETSYDSIDNTIITADYYIQKASAGNALFLNEKAYSNMNWEDDGYRLLALFRYWNMIEYFFPYKYLTDKKWDDVLLEYIPKILESNEELSYKLTLIELVGELQDSHAVINTFEPTLNAFFGNRVVPIKIDFVENKPIITKIYEKYPLDDILKVGFEITSINNNSVNVLLNDIQNYYPASNKSAQKRDIARNILRTNDETLLISFKYNNEVFTKELPTIKLHEFTWWINDDSSHKELQSDEIGYINLGKLKIDEVSQIMEKFSTKKGIIIDCRAFPTDFLVFELTKYFVPKSIEFVKFSTVSLEKPGTFSFTEPLVVGEDNPEYYKGKIAILVNENTQSSGEYHTMAFRVAPKSKVFGSQTAGADGNVSAIVLPGNVRTMISGIGVYYPDGTQTQRVGIVPDVEVKPTIKGIIDGKDEILEAAIQYINKDSDD